MTDPICNITIMDMRTDPSRDQEIAFRPYEAGTFLGGGFAHIFIQDNGKVSVNVSRFGEMAIGTPFDYVFEAPPIVESGGALDVVLGVYALLHVLCAIGGGVANSCHDGIRERERVIRMVQWILLGPFVFVWRFCQLLGGTCTVKWCAIGLHDWFTVRSKPGAVLIGDICVSDSSVLDRICKRCNKLDLQLQRAIDAAEQKQEHEKMLTEIVAEVTKR